MTYVAAPTPRARPRRRTIALVTLLLFTALVALAGSDHRTLPPARGVSLHGTTATNTASAATAQHSFRVASFNIHSGRDVDGDFDLQRTADGLRGFDLIALNEVNGAYDWQSGDQAELLGRRLDMPWLFAPTTRRWWRDDFGNGLLCSLPLADWQRVPLSGTRGKGHRNYLLSTVDFGGRSVKVLVTHLDRVQDRSAQLTSVIDAFLALPSPAILMGDLNTTAADPQLSRLLANPEVHDAVAEGLATAPPKRIDWIITRGLRGIAAGVEQTGASDHPLVWAELQPID